MQALRAGAPVLMARVKLSAPMPWSSSLFVIVFALLQQTQSVHLISSSFHLLAQANANRLKL
jgi:hypothetical protein